MSKTARDNLVAWLAPIAGRLRALRSSPTIPRMPIR